MYINSVMVTDVESCRQTDDDSVLASDADSYVKTDDDDYENVAVSTEWEWICLPKKRLY